jgi:hypothetical protein
MPRNAPLRGLKKPRTTPRFRQREIARAARGLKAAGMKVDRVVIERDGKVVLMVDKNGDTARADDDAPEDLVSLIR